MKFKQLIKRKNGTERTQMKGIVSIRGYYPDVNVILTDAGFSKMYRLPDFDSKNRTEYEAKVKSILHYGKDLSTQVCHIRGKDYMVISVKAESVDDALVRFDELGIEMQELSIAEWCDIITSLTQNQAFSDKNLIGAVNKKGKPTGSLAPHLQPYTSATRLDPNGKALKTDTSKTMDMNDIFVRTMILTSIPDKVYSSLCMELGAVSDSISTSLFFREIDKEKCLYSIKNFKKQMSHNVSEHKLAQMESLLEGENRLINAALFVSIQADNLSDIDDLTEKVRGIAKKYLANINLLEYQQVSAFRSILPLGMSYIKINKAISEDDLMGLLPVSWSKYVAKDVSYGTDLETDKEIFYNRTMTGGFGFVLGSDAEIIEKRIMKEAEQYAALGKKVEIYVIDPRVTPAIFDAYDFDMRSHLELFTNEERELLKPENNNRMFEFKNIKDISRAERMVDKIVMQDVKDLKILGIDFESQALLKGQFNAEKLGRMTAKETRYLIKDLNKMLQDGTLSDEKVLGIQGLINKLNSKVLLSGSMEKISKLNLRSGTKSLLMLAGGDEIFDSDIGQGFGYVNRFYRFSKTATVTGVHAAKLAGKATHKVAKTVAPEITDVVDKEIEKVITAPKNAAKAVGEHARSSRAGKLLGEKHKSFSELHKRMRDKIASSKFGKAIKFGDEARKKVTGVVSAPFKFVSKITDFIKKQVLIPIVLGCGGLFLMFILFGMIGGGGGSAASIIILSDEDQFKDYQAKYDSCDEQFQAQVSSIINGNAQTSNLRGQAIPYGINVPGITTNGLSVPAEYKNGVTLNYFYDGTQIAGISSNIEDCLSAMAVIMQQNQSAHHAEALELLEAIYKSTHSYTTSESALYPCTAGCVDELYYCNQHKGQTAEDGTAGAAYWSTDMRFKPWTYEELYKPQEWQSKYNPGQECAVCRFIDGTPYEAYAGCTVVGTCYHGDGGNMGRSKDPNCANYQAIYDCPGHDHTDSDGNDYTTYCGGPLGCEGYWECQGHNHWGCPDGHHTPVCYGHVDLTMSVNIASLNRIYDMGGVEIKGEKDLPEESTTAPESTEASQDENQEGGEE